MSSNKMLDKIKNKNESLAQRAMPIFPEKTADDPNNNSDDNINIDNNNASNMNSNHDSDIDNNGDFVNNDDITSDHDNDSKTKNDVFDALLTKKKIKKDKIFVGIYFDPEVANVLEKLHKKLGKGIKSELVNEAVKKVLIEKGLM